MQVSLSTSSVRKGPSAGDQGNAAIPPVFDFRHGRIIGGWDDALHFAFTGVYYSLLRVFKFWVRRIATAQRSFKNLHKKLLSREEKKLKDVKIYVGRFGSWSCCSNAQSLARWQIYIEIIVLAGK